MSAGGDGPRVPDPELALDRLLVAVARPPMPPGFFTRQRASILTRVQERARQPELLRVPTGTMALLALVVSVYVYLGLELAPGSSLGAARVGTDPLDSVALVYLGAAALAVWAAVRDGDREATVTSS